MASINYECRWNYGKTVSSRISRGHALMKVTWITVLLLSTVNVAGSATTIWEESSSPLPFTWNHTNFDGFNVSGTGTEDLIILQTNLKADQRTIDKNNLMYTTTAQPVPLKVVTALNLTDPFVMIEKVLNELYLVMHLKMANITYSTGRQKNMWL